jgi:hypothetical protein
MSAPAASPPSKAVATIRAYYAALEKAQGDEPSLRRVIDAFYTDDALQVRR